MPGKIHPPDKIYPPGKIYPIDPNRPDSALIQRAARTMKTGGIIVFPTSGLYGLGADATNRDAVQRIFEIKHRTGTKPILILIRNTRQLDRLVTTVPETAHRLIERHWPGGITLVCHARRHLPPQLTAGTGKIGIRLPAHPVAAALVNAVDFPITATSANVSGRPGCAAIEDLGPSFIEEVDFVLNAGTLSGGQGSTVVDVTSQPPEILRPGIVPAEQIFSIKTTPSR